MNSLQSKGRYKMKNLNDLRNELSKIDNRSYKAYKQIEGCYDFENYILSIDHVQGDPFASPSRVKIIINNKITTINNLFLNFFKLLFIFSF